MAKVKEVSSYSGSAWSAATPLGADATNIDMTSNPSDYDSSTEETSTEIIGTNDVKVISSDTDLTAWGKFNRFRKRVANAFGTLSGKTLATAYTTTSADSKIYSASVLNSYMTNVIGYSGTTAPSAGTVASQLSSLNSNKLSTSTILLANYKDSYVRIVCFAIPTSNGTMKMISIVMYTTKSTSGAASLYGSAIASSYRPTYGGVTIGMSNNCPVALGTDGKLTHYDTLPANTTGCLLYY